MKKKLREFIQITSVAVALIIAFTLFALLLNLLRYAFLRLFEGIGEGILHVESIWVSLSLGVQVGIAGALVLTMGFAIYLAFREEPEPPKKQPAPPKPTPTSEKAAARKKYLKEKYAREPGAQPVAPPAPQPVAPPAPQSVAPPPPGLMKERLVSAARTRGARELAKGAFLTYDRWSRNKPN